MSPNPFLVVASIALLNATRKLVDAAVPMSPEVAEQALIAYVSRSAPSEHAARHLVAAEGGWLGAVRNLFIRMRAKALAARAEGILPRPSVCHTLCESAAVLRRAGIAMPADAEAEAMARKCFLLGKD